MKKLKLIMPRSLVTVGEYVFENASSPIVYATPDQFSEWNANWESNCRKHGFFLSKNVITRKL
jgi:hypothetical protein